MRRSMRRATSSARSTMASPSGVSEAIRTLAWSPEGRRVTSRFCSSLAMAVAIVCGVTAAALAGWAEDYSGT